MTKELTDKQKKFLSVLFEEAKGNVTEAKKIAGYSPNTATREVTESLEEEIQELTKKFIRNSATKAAYAMYNVLENPTDLGTKETIAAAKDLLDRSGHKPSDRLEVSAPNPIFILPEKK